MVAWGGKLWTGQLWPSAHAPEWANTAATRMQSMNVPWQRINEVLQEMRNERVKAKLTFGDTTYDVVME